MNLLSWILRIVAAGILLRTLYFKFSAAPESVYIFSQLGVEPWGRILTGVLELIVGILLLLPRTAWMGAVGGLGIISGAILSHLTILGIEVQGDGGLVFTLALIVLVACAIVLYLHRDEAWQFVQNLRRRTAS